MNILELSEQEICRRNSLEELRRMGIDPYPAAEFPVNAYTTEIKESFNDEDEPREVCVAGRIMGRRIMGKASFAELLDSKGKSKCILLARIFARKKIKTSTTSYSRSCWIWATLSV